MEIAVPHIPVLLDKALDLLQVRRKGIYVDCTTGSGGHSEEILDRLGNTGQLIAVDRDMEAVETVQRPAGTAPEKTFTSSTRISRTYPLFSAA